MRVYKGDVVTPLCVTVSLHVTDKFNDSVRIYKRADVYGSLYLSVDGSSLI